MNGAGSFVLPVTREFYFWLGSKSTRCRGAAYHFGNGEGGDQEPLLKARAIENGNGAWI
jgi:hypothetical protein